MSLFRRWFDPIRSRWFYKKPHRQDLLPIDDGISIYLRLDDVYSYLIVQQLAQLEQILADLIKPLHIIISDQAAPAPNGMNEADWQAYCFNDAKILAKQHGFAYDDFPESPKLDAIVQAKLILETTPLQGQEFLYLLEDVYHMLWQQQYGKLKLLYSMAQSRPVQPSESELTQHQFSHQPVQTAYFQFGGRRYQAVDDLLRLSRRLKQQNLLTGPAIFLINHIEWGEHLINDPEPLHEIQKLQPRLTIYVALEDPMTWLLLAYIKSELADYYNIQLLIKPLPYQQKDYFDWALAARLSKRAQVDFTPFCRPDLPAVEAIAQQFYQCDDDERVELLIVLLKAAWTQGRDLGYKPHLSHIMQTQAKREMTLISMDDVRAQLKANQAECQLHKQPHLPVLVLEAGDKRIVFNSLYRIWMIESILSHWLSEQD